MNVSISRDGAEVGVWPEDQIKFLYLSGKLQSTDYFRREGTSEWGPLLELINPVSPGLGQTTTSSISGANAAFEGQVTRAKALRMTKIEAHLFSLRGRLGRLKFFGLHFLYVSIFIITNCAFGVFQPSTNLATDAGIFPSFVLVVTFFPLMWLELLLIVKRLHDLGLSGWYALISCVPPVGVVFGFYLLFARGQTRANRFGPPPI
jgi:uncharacterized membrane protein YhaH (DUF805 family)